MVYTKGKSFVMLLIFALNKAWISKPIVHYLSRMMEHAFIITIDMFLLSRYLILHQHDPTYWEEVCIQRMM